MDELQNLERLRERIESLERTASLGFLLSAVVHEINNPLSVILIGADTLRRKAEDPEAVEHHLAVLEAQSAKIIEINKLLQGLCKRNLDGAVAADAADLIHAFAAVEGLLGGASHQPVLDLQEGPLPIEVQPQQMMQALRYLASAVRELGGVGSLRVNVDRQEIPLIELPSIRQSPTREFVVVGLRVGDPAGATEPVTEWIGDFFGDPPSPIKVDVMAAWEVMRKLPGRLRIRADASGAEILAMIPVAAGETR